VHREVLSAGEGPPLLFVHGLGHGAWCFAEAWLPAAAERGYRAHALSLRGHGGSGGQNDLGRTTLRDYEHDVLQTIAGLPQPPVLIGHSLGSLVVQRVLQRYPARAGVLLTPIPAVGAPATIAQMTRRKPGEMLRATAGATLRLTAEDLFADLPADQARDFASRVGRESRWAQYAMMRPERVGPIDAPLLVVGAEQDRLVARADVQRCADSLGADLMWVPGGHDVMLDGARLEVLDTVLAWVARTCPPGPPLPGARFTQPLQLS
jgi:pimeloyl-ACP methyl ester carboxylesterase